MLNRRHLLTISAAGAATSLAQSAVGKEHRDDVQAPRAPVVDTNVSLFRWPFRRLPWDEPSRLLDKLRRLGIVEAWVGSHEALLQRDITEVNQRLAAYCNRFNANDSQNDTPNDAPSNEASPAASAPALAPLRLKPMGAVNLRLPDWEADAQRCLFGDESSSGDESNSGASFHGVRLLPNYHGYTLDDQRFGKLLQMAAESGRWVQIATAMEDQRTQLELVRRQDVDLTPLIGAMAKAPQARVQLLNARLRPTQIAEWQLAPRLYWDTARLDSTDGVPLAHRAAPGRLLFGSGAPC